MRFEVRTDERPFGSSLPTTACILPRWRLADCRGCQWICSHRHAIDPDGVALQDAQLAPAAELPHLQRFVRGSEDRSFSAGVKEVTRPNSSPDDDLSNKKQGSPDDRPANCHPIDDTISSGMAIDSAQSLCWRTIGNF